MEKKESKKDKLKNQSDNKIYKFLPIIIISILGILYLTTLNRELGGFGGDNAEYILLAEAIGKGQGYRSINIPGSPVNNHYPPCYPLLLLPIVISLGYNFLFMHLQIIILSFLSLTIFYLINQDLFSSRGVSVQKLFPLVVVFIFGMHPHIVSYQIQILSEIPYIFFSLASIYFILKYYKSEGIRNKFLLFSSFSILLTVLTRTIGLSLYLAILLFSLLMWWKDKSYFTKSLVLLSFSFTPFMIWALWLKNQAGSISSYVSEYSIYFKSHNQYSNILISIYDLLIARIGTNIRNGNLGEFLLNNTLLPPKILAIFGGITIILLLIGLGNIFFKRNEYLIIVLYFITYLIIVLLVPSREIQRYSLPLLPLYISFIFYGIAVLLEKYLINLKNNKIVLGFILFMGIILFKVPQGVSMYLCLQSNSHFPPKEVLSQELYELKKPINWSYFGETLNLMYAKKDYRPRAVVLYKLLAILEYIKRYIPSEAIISARKPRIVSLFTGKRALRYPHEKSKVMDFIKNEKINYIIIDQYSDAHGVVLPVIIQNKDKFRLILDLDGTYLFQSLSW